VAVSTVLGLSSALAGEPMSEPVNMKELPAAVQKTITEKAAGGKIAGWHGKTIATVGGTTKSW
jgi:hypothetical protein